MWILAEDVRDGQRLAFPQFAAAVTMDVAGWVKSLREKLRVLQKQRDAVIARVRAEMLARMSEVSAQDEEDVLASDELQLQQLRERFDDEIQAAESRLKVEEQVEALVYFDNKEWPVRSVTHASSWDFVRGWTSRTGVVDTTNLPRLDK